MCTMCYLLFIACSLLMTNASILNDLQEAQRFVEQLDYDYSAVAADAAAQQQRPAAAAAAAADLLWYDYGGGSIGGGGGGGGGGGYYGVGGSTVPAAAAVQLIGAADKRGGATQSSGGIWFGPRLGRRKRRGGVGGGLVQPVDGNAVGPVGPLLQEPAAAVAGQSVVGGAWVFVPIIDNAIYSQMKQNARSGRSSSEDGDEVASASRHAARSPPYSPPFSPRLGRQVTAQARPQVPRLGREALLYRRDARSASYQQNASSDRGGGSPYRLPEHQQHLLQPSSSSAVTQSAAATAEARSHVA